jgi:predicted HicB family RNase H-like nuclease
MAEREEVKNLSVPLPPAFREAIRAAAAQEYISPAAWARRALARAVEA